MTFLEGHGLILRIFIWEVIGKWPGLCTHQSGSALSTREIRIPSYVDEVRVYFARL